MALEYAVVEIWTSETAQWRGRPLAEAVVQVLKAKKVPARCVVMRGSAGCYENGEEASQNILMLSMNMPIKVEIVLPRAELDAVLAAIDPLVTDGIVSVRDPRVLLHRTRRHLMPAGLLVRDVMTPDPQSVSPDTPVIDVIRTLLRATFHGMPVADAQDRVVGIITQIDLIRRAELPVRLGLLARFEQSLVEAHLEGLAHRQARDVMTSPVVTARDDQPVAEAVKVMLGRELKRMPVVNRDGKLCGMLSRVDVFKIARETGQVYDSLARNQVDVHHIRFVRDIMQRDMQTVTPDTPVPEVLKVIGGGPLQRVAVVDASGHFQGVIFDHDLLAAFSEHAPGLLDLVISRFAFTEVGRKHRALVDRLQAETAAGLMQRDIVTVREDAPISEAIRVMTERQFKRLPVVDESGVFKGMVSRDAVLRAGVSASGRDG